MTDNEIIKALECCRNDECSQCPLQDGVCSEKDVIKDALDLINRQKAEIERLNKRVDGQKKAMFEQQSYTAELQAENKKLSHKCDDCAGCTQWKCDCSNIKSKAIKEFVKKFENEIKDVQFTLGQTWELQCALKNVVKEMVGEGG